MTINVCTKIFWINYTVFFFRFYTRTMHFFSTAQTMTSWKLDCLNSEKSSVNTFRIKRNKTFSKRKNTHPMMNSRNSHSQCICLSVRVVFESFFVISIRIILLGFHIRIHNILISQAHAVK